jgi:hypothetical protein
VAHLGAEAPVQARCLSIRPATRRHRVVPVMMPTMAVYALVNDVATGDPA